MKQMKDSLSLSSLCCSYYRRQLPEIMCDPELHPLLAAEMTNVRASDESVTREHPRHIQIPERPRFRANLTTGNKTPEHLCVPTQ